VVDRLAADRSHDIRALVAKLRQTLNASEDRK
jgi:hypothetical protein